MNSARRADEDEFTHYDRLWRYSSRSERAALLRVSESGFVNPKRRWAEDRLVARGLLNRKPVSLTRDAGFENFPQFVSSSHHRYEVELWESEGATGRRWRALRWLPIAVAIAIGLFLVSTQAEVREVVADFDAGGTAFISILGTLAGGVLAIRQLLVALKGGARD